MPEKKQSKAFWRRPEGVTGIIFLIGLLVGLGFLIANIIPLLNTLPFAIAAGLIVFATIFAILDPKTRALISYMYKSSMRWITSLFVQLDPIAIMKSYVAELQGKLKDMNKQVAKLRGQMHKLQEVIYNNKKQIQSHLVDASQAKKEEQRTQVILKTRKAGRLKDSNMRLEELYNKMQKLYRVLTKMQSNAEILMEDVKDQVMIKEQERNAIHASTSAMRSAMSVIQGDPDKRAMFDQAMEAMTEDISNKVGEMERFMQISANFMDSIDVQNGIFEEQGIKMLEKWEQEADSLILGNAKQELLEMDDVLDLNAPIEQKEKSAPSNQYDSFFDF